MNKRTLVFVLLVGVVFFGLNLFFSSQNDQKNREILKQREALKAKEQMQLSADVIKRTAKLEDLPIVELYLNEKETNPSAYGLQTDGNVLTLAWKEPSPQTVYVNGAPKSLATKQSVKEGAILYVSKNFENLEIAALPDIGLFDVQLLYFPPGQKPKIVLGEYSERRLTLRGEPLSENALVIYHTPSGWLPLGFYEWRGGLFIPLQDLPILSDLTKVSAPVEISKELQKDQKYYVLENAYQQLVFTNVGGALVEINLPFESETDTSSVVREIGFDREIIKDSPANAHFPAHPYFLPGSTVEHAPSTVGGYYPLLRRGIWNKKIVETTPQNYALNIVSDYPEMAELVYTVKEFTPSKIVFEATQPHRRITKTFTLAEKNAPYVLDLAIQIDGDSRGLWLTSGIPEVEIMSNSSSPQIQYRLSRNGKGEVEKLDLPKPKEFVSISSVYPDWVSNSNGYLGMILDPLTEIGAGYRVAALPGAQVPTRLSVINPEYQPYPPSKYPGYQVQLPLAAKSGLTKIRVFAGPFEESILKTVDRAYSDPATGYNPDYIASISFYGWFSFISEPFSKFLFVVMKFFYSITGSWGFSIILLTVFLRLILYPLNAWSFKSMRRMQQLSPYIQAIQQKHKKDPKKAQAEIMALYREKKANPFTGCVPILIQIPFLIAMFDLLKSSFQLRGASFIPGWIDNLTAPDVLFQWQTPIFFIGNQFHLLPVILGVVMFFQQKFSSTAPSDPSKMTDQQRQQKAMGSIMAVVFMIMFYHFPSGLNIYWLSSMLLGILQQWITNRVLDKKKEEEKPLILDKNSDTKKGSSKKVVEKFKG